MGLKVSTNPMAPCTSRSRPARETPSVACVSISPNKFLVYQHDTPEKQLFAYDKRAFSHGCMRVQDPVKYAEVLLSIVRPHDGYTQERIRSMFGNNEQDIQFPTLIPVHLTYQTAFVDDDGKLAIPRGRLWPRQGAIGYPQGRRAQSGGHSDRTQRKRGSSRASSDARANVFLWRARRL